MDALEDQRATKRTFTPDSPFKQVETLVKAQYLWGNHKLKQIALSHVNGHGRNLPGPLGDIGLNLMYVD